MLLTNTRAEGIAIPLAARIATGTRGHAVRHVEVTEGSAELRASARHAAEIVYDVLHRERYLSRHVVVRYEPGASVVNVHGRSAELALALAHHRADRQLITGLSRAESAMQAVERLPISVPGLKFGQLAPASRSEDSYPYKSDSSVVDLRFLGAAPGVIDIAHLQGIKDPH